jgi:HEAT repeat protein
LRGAVASALGASGDPAAASPLVDLLQTDADDVVRTFAARALGSLGRPESLASLRGALGSRSVPVRVGVATALGEIGDPSAIEALAGLREDRDVAVRIRAVQALGKIDDSRVVEPLCAYLLDRKRIVRVDAAKALGRIGDERAVLPLTNAYRRQRYPYKLLIGDQLATLRRRIQSTGPS